MLGLLDDAGQHGTLGSICTHQLQSRHSCTHTPQPGTHPLTVPHHPIPPDLAAAAYRVDEDAVRCGQALLAVTLQHLVQRDHCTGQVVTMEVAIGHEDARRASVIRGFSGGRAGLQFKRSQ